jgi:hypothetical protein
MKERKKAIVKVTYKLHLASRAFFLTAARQRQSDRYLTKLTRRNESSRSQIVSRKT